MWASVSLFCRFTDMNVYGTGYVKMWRTRHKTPAGVRQTDRQTQDPSLESDV